MQRGESELEIEGHSVYVGSMVNVKWRGEWYEGKVVKLGPHRKLCKVHDVATDQRLLVDPRHLKLMETHALNRQFSRGTQVMYYDGQSWQEGLVERSNATGAALVKWRRRDLSEENETWFEVTNIAPVIPNEAYQASSEDLLKAGKSGQLYNNMIEPQPRTVNNVLYQSESEQSDKEQDSPVRTHSSGSRKFEQHMHPKVNSRIPFSPTYESISSEDILGDHRYDHLAPTPPPKNFHPMSNSAGMVYPYLPVFFQGNTKHSPSFHSAQSFLGPRLRHLNGFRRGLEQSSLPCVRSYKGQTNGIPPHHTSKFFDRFQKFPNLHAWNRFRVPLTRSITTIKRSPTAVSDAMSDPSPYAEHFFVPPHLHRLYGQSKNVSRQSSLGGHHKKRLSPKHKEATQVPQPYEVPQRPQSDLKYHRRRANDPVNKLQGVPRNKTDRVEYAEVDFSPRNRAPVVVSSSQSELKVPYGGSILLTCVSDSRIPGRLSYEWLKDGKKIPVKSQNRMQPAPGMLKILQASMEDAGEYSCVVRNDHGSDSRTFHLEVVRVDSLSKRTETSRHTMAGMNTEFNKVTYEELNMEPPREHNGSTENQPGSLPPSHHNSDVSDEEPTRQEERNTTEEPENELEEEVEQDTLQREDTTEGDQTVLEEKQKDTDDRRDEALAEEHSVPRTPQIVVTTERNIEKHKRKRVSSVLKNDIDQYLVGYGEDYGVLSSVTDLDQEGLKRFGRRDIAKRTKRNGGDHVHKLKPREKSAKTKHESKATVPEAKADSPPQKSKKLPSFPKFSKGPKFVKKQGFSASDVLHRGEESVQMTARLRDLPEPGQLSVKQKETHPAEDTNVRKDTNLKSNHTEDPAETRPRAQSADSIAVNTSVGSSCSDSETPLDVEEGADTVLPQEMETVAEQVMRLQSSIETHAPEIAVQGKKKGFISSLFTSKNKVVTTTA